MMGGFSVIISSFAEIYIYRLFSILTFDSLPVSSLLSAHSLVLDLFSRSNGNSVIISLEDLLNHH